MSNLQDFHAGVAFRKLAALPPGLFKLSGMPRKVETRPNEQELRVEVLSFSCGEEIALVITHDFLGNRRIPDMVSIREKVAVLLHCDPLRILFSATHCHSSWPEPNPSESEEAKEARFNFERHIEEAVIEACVEAHQKMRPAEVGYRRVELNGAISECRRTVISNGVALNSWGMGAVAPPGLKFVEKADEIDDSIDILFVRGQGEDQPFAALMSYGSHIHLLPVPYVNGELAGWVKEEMERRIPGLTALYSTHAAGDVSLKWSEPPPTSGSEQEEWLWHNHLGRNHAKHFTDAVISGVRSVEYCNPRFILHESDRWANSAGGNSFQSVYALVMGDIALVNFKPELFNSYGIEIRNKSPFEKLILTGYNESDFPYVGSPINHEQGSYEMNKGIIPRSAAQEEEFINYGFPINPARPEYGKETVVRILRLLENIKQKMRSE